MHVDIWSREYTSLKSYWVYWWKWGWNQSTRKIEEFASAERKKCENVIGESLHSCSPSLQQLTPNAMLNFFFFFSFFFFFLSLYYPLSRMHKFSRFRKAVKLGLTGVNVQFIGYFQHWTFLTPIPWKKPKKNKQAKTLKQQKADRNCAFLEISGYVKNWHIFVIYYIMPFPSEEHFNQCIVKSTDFRLLFRR